MPRPERVRHLAATDAGYSEPILRLDHAERPLLPPSDR